MKKLLLSLPLAALLTLTLAPPTSAATPPDSCFAFNAGTGTITDYYDHEGDNSANPACTRDVDIPSTIGGVGVTAIGVAANYWSTTTATSFAYKALTSVTIPSSITSIGDYAFYKNQLTTITIPNSVTNVGNSAFSYNQLTSAIIANSVTSIGSSAFYGNQLTTVTIPNSVTNVGNSAFSANQLSSVTIPSSVTSIGSSAFRGNQLTSVTIPNSVTSIGSYAFSVNRLADVVIESNPSTIGSRVLDLNPIQSITYDGIQYTAGQQISETCYGFNSGRITAYYYADLNHIKTHSEACLDSDLIVPSQIGGVPVTAIGSDAFKGKNLLSVTIPIGITSIGDRAFMGNQLSAVNLPEGLQTIGWYAFYGNRIEDVYAPDSLTFIEFNAFFMQNKWGGLIEWFTLDDVPYVWSDNAEEINLLFDNIWYAQIYTANLTNPNDLQDSIVSEDWEYAFDANANGLNDSIGGHLINPSNVNLKYIDQSNTNLQTAQSFTGIYGESYLNNYMASLGPVIPMPADLRNITSEEQAAIDEALSAYYRIGDEVTITPPDIDGYITPPTQTFVLGDADNEFSYIYSTPEDAEGSTGVGAGSGGDSDSESSAGSELANTGINGYAVALIGVALIMFAMYVLGRFRKAGHSKFIRA